MAWKKIRDNSKFLRFEKDKSFEGIYQGFEERENPFYDETNPNSTKTIVDYKLTINDKEMILSSTANTLRSQLMPLIAPCEVKIDCIQQGIKKFFTVWTKE